eukprot:TRINITY_DN20341_c0_g1_i1.p2 TRINITY_DN20341_c0_g1~~TRINITY_DN20341_c0_g1_i1.p2  ORF type:complete len:293 (+),score=54.70 TRINITY_DN20341_c0_g1_i1:76-879(+)
MRGALRAGAAAAARSWVWRPPRLPHHARLQPLSTPPPRGPAETAARLGLRPPAALAGPSPAAAWSAETQELLSPARPLRPPHSAQPPRPPPGAQPPGPWGEREEVPEDTVVWSMTICGFVANWVLCMLGGAVLLFTLTDAGVPIPEIRRSAPAGRRLPSQVALDTAVSWMPVVTVISVGAAAIFASRTGLAIAQGFGRRWVALFGGARPDGLGDTAVARGAHPSGVVALRHRSPYTGDWGKGGLDVGAVTGTSTLLEAHSADSAPRR